MRTRSGRFTSLGNLCKKRGPRPLLVDQQGQRPFDVYNFLAFLLGWGTSVCWTGRVKTPMVLLPA